MTSRLLTVSIFGIGLVVWILTGFSRTAVTERDRLRPTVRSTRADLDVVLIEPGVLQPVHSITLASEIRSNRAKIVSILSDGAWVKAGDVVIRFDPTPFEEEHAKAQAEYRDALAQVSRAQQEQKLEIAKAEESVASSKRAAKLAKLNLDSFEQGSGALGLREAEVRSAQTDGQLSMALREMRDLEEMLGRGFVSEAEVARQRNKLADLQRQSGLEGDKLRSAKNVEYPRERERARSQVEDANNAQSRSEAVLYYSHEFYQAAQESLQRKAEAAKEALRVSEEQLKKTTITSPIDGFLILQTIPLDNGKRKPQVGDSVWSGVPIAMVPDLSEMIAQTRVREIDLHRIRAGMTTRLSVEAYPDLSIDGQVGTIGNLAENVDDSPWNFFRVIVKLAGSDPRLRPGMSTRVSFLIDSVKDAVIVPIDAVFTRGSASLVYLRRGQQVVAQEVRLGLQNETHVSVLEGVDPGEEILLEAPASDNLEVRSLSHGTT